MLLPPTTFLGFFTERTLLRTSSSNKQEKDYLTQGATSCHSPDVAETPQQTSAVDGVGPSHPPPALTSSSDDANARALLHAKMVHRMSPRCPCPSLLRPTGFRNELWPWRAVSRKPVVSSEPSSTHPHQRATHESGSLPNCPVNSGYVLSFLLRAGCQSCAIPPARTEDVGGHLDSQVTPTWCLLPIGALLTILWQTDPCRGP